MKEDLKKLKGLLKQLQDESKIYNFDKKQQNCDNSENKEPVKDYKIRKQSIMNVLSNDRKFSQALVIDYLDIDLRRVYVSGQTSPYTGEPNQGDFQAAVDKVYEDIEALINLSGGNMNDLVETVTIVPNGWTDDKINALLNTRTRVYGENAVYPTSTAISAGLVDPSLLIEIKATAEFRIPKRWKIKSDDEDIIIRRQFL